MSAISTDLYTRLGNSGLKISKGIVGCMSFGKKSWQEWVIEDEDAVMDILKKAYDSGIRTYDTADVYSDGESEILLGKFLKKFNIPRREVVILSKCFFYVDESKTPFVFGAAASEKQINTVGLSRKHIFDAVQASIERLGTYIDVYQIHRYDPETPQEETMRALNDVIEKGWVRYIGASAMKAYQFINYQHIAEKNGWSKFISMQNYYNLLNREEDREMNEYCRQSGVGLIPYSPVAKGVLCRPYTETPSTERAGTDKSFARYNLNRLGESDIEIINRVEELAKKYGVSMTAVSVAWCISKDANPIVGLSSPKRVDDLVEGCLLKIDPKDIAYLDEPYTAKEASV